MRFYNLIVIFLLTTQVSFCATAKEVFDAFSQYLIEKHKPEQAQPDEQGFQSIQTRQVLFFLRNEIILREDFIEIKRCNIEFVRANIKTNPVITKILSDGEYLAFIDALKELSEAFDAQEAAPALLVQPLMEKPANKRRPKTLKRKLLEFVVLCGNCAGAIPESDDERHED